MGVKNYLIEGVSGAGKTSVAEELQRRGHHVVHGDRELAYVGDPATGEPLDRRGHERAADSASWIHEHHLWRVDKVQALVADRGHALTFFCGGSRNLHRFIDLFDEVFILEIDRATLDRRLAARPPDEFGGRPNERRLIERLHATQEDMPKRGVRIDATAPLDRVVDAILEKCT
ncbi:MAG: nucleoside kinase [Alphaproteobacteria bacterium]|nr:nucleoside kinase [Alphaproteobacteria bacterium]